MQRHWSRILALMAIVPILTLIGTGCGGSTDSAGGPSGNSDAVAWAGLEAGMKLAAETGRPVLLDFYTNWCGWCKKMDKETYADPKVARLLNEKFVSIKVDAEGAAPMNYNGAAVTGRSLARDFGVRGYPTVWFLGPDGSRIAPFPGYQGPEDFAQVLEYIGDGYYKKMSFPEFVTREAS